MTTIRTFIVVICMTALSALAFAQSAEPPHIAPTAAKDHVGETVTVCGKVVGTKIGKYGIAKHGKPVNFDLDQPEPDTAFFFVAFGTEAGGPQEAIAAYKDKSVCVTGKVAEAGNKPYILAADRTMIKPQPDKPAAEIK